MYISLLYNAKYTNDMYDFIRKTKIKNDNNNYNYNTVICKSDNWVVSKVVGLLILINFVDSKLIEWLLNLNIYLLVFVCLIKLTKAINHQTQITMSKMIYFGYLSPWCSADQHFIYTV